MLISVPADYYQQFDADFSLEVPAEGYGGWKRTTLELPVEHTAVVFMHAWDTGTRQQYPGWHRVVEYIPRADRILRDVFPPLLAAVRSSPLKLYHVVGGGSYAEKCPGYQATKALPGAIGPEIQPIQPDPATAKLFEFQRQHATLGRHNEADVTAGFARIDFPSQARPIGDEPIAENEHQLFALCQRDHISHLIYAGFAINWCLLMSRGGMVDMSRRGLMCSALRQAVTAVENKESARRELAKELGLWRVAMRFGFVFDVPEFIAAVSKAR